MVFEKFSEISEFYPDIIIDKFIVMPNHLHAILLIQHTGTARGPFPTMIKIVIEYFNTPERHRGRSLLE